MNNLTGKHRDGVLTEVEQLGGWTADSGYRNISLYWREPGRAVNQEAIKAGHQ
jgi:hypothetical protein